MVRTALLCGARDYLLTPERLLIPPTPKEETSRANTLYILVRNWTKDLLPKSHPPPTHPSLYTQLFIKTSSPQSSFVWSSYLDKHRRRFDEVVSENRVKRTVLRANVRGTEKVVNRSSPNLFANTMWVSEVRRFEIFARLRRAFGEI